MKFRKYIALLFVMAIFQIATAQQDQKGHPRNDLQSLDLSPEQKEQIKAIKRANRQERQALQQEQSENYRKELQTLRQEEKEAIQALLSDEQKTQLDQIRADRKAARKAKAEKVKAMSKALKAHHQEKVRPVLLVQRAKLEEQLSQEDKASIAALRTKMESIKAQAKQEAEARKQNGTEDRHHPSSRSYRQSIRAIGHEEDFWGPARALAIKYQENIQALSEEISAERAQFAAEREAIIESYTSADEELNNAYQKRKKRKGKGQSKQFKKRGQAIQFLLLNPNEATERIENNNLSPNPHQLKVYPNPSDDSQNLSFWLEQSGQVRINLLDKNGRLIRQLQEGQMEVGEQNLNFDLGDLPSGLYYYQIVDAQGASVEKVVIK